MDAAPSESRAVTRAEKPVLCKEAIIDAALRIIETEGISALSMRRVAQEVGTSPATLYAHVVNKDELLDLVVHAVMAQIAGQSATAGHELDWTEDLKEAVRRGFQVLHSHGDVAKAFPGRIPFSPNGLRVVELQLRILRAGGVPDGVAANVGGLLRAHVVSSVIDREARIARSGGANRAGAATEMTKISSDLTPPSDARCPNMAALADGSATGGSDSFDRFELGLEIIVRGIASFAEAIKDSA